MLPLASVVHTRLGRAAALAPGESDPAVEQLCSFWQQCPVPEGIALVVVVDDSRFCSATLDNFLWVCFTRSNPASDLYGVGGGFRQRHWGCSGPLVIDARSKPFHAPPLEEEPALVRKVEELAAAGGPLYGLF
jgi:4-hydroxy-3-polyprenylbenzoate decarboxylase